jgi:glycine/D-amino acid oxidase-like deaminating enzyme
MSARQRVAVLGAGIMGCCTALWLSRMGARSVLFDAEAEPFAGASRWNEGKIHLGYLYAASPSLDTARSVLSGGIRFRDDVRSLLGTDPAQAATQADDTYLVHRDSVVDAALVQRYFSSVDDLVAGHPLAERYFVPLGGTRTRALSKQELSNLSGSPDIVAGFRVAERSVCTQWLADRFAEAVLADARIETAFGHRVTGVERSCNASVERFSVVIEGGRQEGFDAVVNALWQGRLAIDASLGIAPCADWTHRYRKSLFLRTRTPHASHSAVIAVGPFGDVKNYDGRRHYLSWYPAGLVAESHDLEPSRPGGDDAASRDFILSETFERLAELLPSIAGLRDDIEDVRVEGGWVYAAGRGALNHPASGLHRRDLAGVQRFGQYFSVDTGKYSTAPTLALQVAQALVSGA